MYSQDKKLIVNRVLPYLFSFVLLFAYSNIDAFEDLPEGYEYADFDDEEIDDADQVYCDKALFKRAAEAPDSNSAMATLEAGPSAVVAGCVNAISGDYFDSHMCLTVPGIQPIVVQCSYCSSEKEWHFQHMPKLEVGQSGGQNHLYARYLDDNGSGMTYRAYMNESCPHGIKGNQLTIPTALFEKGLTNCGSGEISGQTNWRNSGISFVRKDNEKYYMLRHGSHVNRIFKRYKRHSGSKGAPLGKFHLESEHHPNGIRFLYRYNNDDQLFNVEVKNRANHYLGGLSISYKAKSMLWEGFENSVLFYFSDKDKKLISKAYPSHAKCVSYRYKDDLLQKKCLPEGRFLEIEYYDSGEEKGRVRCLKNALGRTHYFRYNFLKAMTTVEDADKNFTQYHYSRDTKRLISVVRFDKKCNTFTKDHFQWSYEAHSLGNLVSRTFEGDGKVHFKRTLAYDIFGNVSFLNTTKLGFSLKKFGMMEKGTRKTICRM